MLVRLKLRYVNVECRVSRFINLKTLCSSFHPTNKGRVSPINWHKRLNGNSFHQGGWTQWGKMAEIFCLQSEFELNMNELRIFGKIIMISRTLDYQLFETVKEERKRKPQSFYSRLKKRHLCREKMIYWSYQGFIWWIQTWTLIEFCFTYPNVCLCQSLL